MFRKALTMALLGVLMMGTATIAYGTFFDKGLMASIGGVMGAGEHDDDHDDDHDRGWRGEHDDD